MWSHTLMRREMLVAVGAAGGLALFTALSAGTAAASAPTSKTIVMIPKQTSDPFFTDAESGAKQAAKSLGYTIDYVGPTTASAAGQVTTLDTALEEHPAGVAIAPDDPNAVAPALQKAMKEGIAVGSFNADATPSSRDFYTSDATATGISKAIVDTMAAQVHDRGTFLLVTSTATAANQKLWLSLMRPYMAKKYPKMKIAEVIPGNDDPATVLQVTSTYLSAHKSTTTGVWVIGGGMSGAVKAEQQLGISPKKMPVAGLCIPSDVKADMNAGLIKNCVLWNPANTAYADVYAINAWIKGTFPKSGNGTIKAGKLGTLQVDNHVVEVGNPIVFTAKTIGNYHF